MAQQEQAINPQTQQLLSQLRDIRGLEDVSWWPLAPGWWILLGLCLAVFWASFFLGNGVVRVRDDLKRSSKLCWRTCEARQT